MKTLIVVIGLEVKLAYLEFRRQWLFWRICALKQEREMLESSVQLSAKTKRERLGRKLFRKIEKLKRVSRRYDVLDRAANLVVKEAL